MRAPAGGGGNDPERLPRGSRVPLSAGRASQSSHDPCLDLSANFTFALEYESFGWGFTPSPVPFAPFVFVPKLHLVCRRAAASDPLLSRSIAQAIRQT